MNTKRTYEKPGKETDKRTFGEEFAHAKNMIENQEKNERTFYELSGHKKAKLLRQVFWTLQTEYQIQWQRNPLLKSTLAFHIDMGLKKDISESNEQYLKQMIITRSGTEKVSVRRFDVGVYLGIALNPAPEVGKTPVTHFTRDSNLEHIIIRELVARREVIIRGEVAPEEISINFYEGTISGDRKYFLPYLRDGFKWADKQRKYAH